MLQIRDIFTLFTFLLSFFATVISGIVMLVTATRPVLDGGQFAVAAVAFFLNALFFLIVHRKVEY